MLPFLGPPKWTQVTLGSIRENGNPRTRGDHYWPCAPTLALHLSAMDFKVFVAVLLWAIQEDSAVLWPGNVQKSGAAVKNGTMTMRLLCWQPFKWFFLQSKDPCQQWLFSVTSPCLPPLSCIGYTVSPGSPSSPSKSAGRSFPSFQPCLSGVTWLESNSASRLGLNYFSHSPSSQSVLLVLPTPYIVVPLLMVKVCLRGAKTEWKEILV